MKYYTILLITLVFTSCTFKEKEPTLNFPLNDIKINAISSENKVDKVSDTLLLRQFEKALSQLSNEDLIKGKRLHGAKKICDLKIKTDKNNIHLFVVRSKENEMVIDFYEFNEKDNFNYFLGALYKTDKLIEVIKNAQINCIN